MGVSLCPPPRLHASPLHGYPSTKWGEFACPRKQYEDRATSYLNLILRSEAL